MKAAWTWADGNVEDEGIRTCADNLVKLLINVAGSLSTQGKPAESEAILHEALQVCHTPTPTNTAAHALHIEKAYTLKYPLHAHLLGSGHALSEHQLGITYCQNPFSANLCVVQYKDLTGDPLVEFDVRMALANNLELTWPGPGDQSLRDRAAVYRQHLITAMQSGSGREEPTQCAVCLSEIDAKQATLVSDGYNPRLVVLPCCHVFHHGCAMKWNAEHPDCPTCRAPLMAFHA